MPPPTAGVGCRVGTPAVEPGPCRAGRKNPKAETAGETGTEKKFEKKAELPHGGLDKDSAMRHRCVLRVACADTYVRKLRTAHCAIMPLLAETVKPLIRVVRKLQFPNKFLLKTHFCKALARFGPKKCKTCSGTNEVPEQVHSNKA